MSDKIAELGSVMAQDQEASWVGQLWSKFYTQMQPKHEEWMEVRNYVTATDTTTTSNSKLPWKNSTTTPKLCQIRDNLHSNYMSSLFPNEDWLQWMAYSKEAASKEKAATIKAYMSNKTRESNYRNEVSKCAFDYIDFGNAFIAASFESRVKVAPDGTDIVDYIGPVAERISPYDVVFNPLAKSFNQSWKIIRSIKTVGEIKKLALTEPDNFFWTEALERREKIDSLRRQGGYSVEDFDKATGFQVDGFGNMYEYYSSDFVEILEFYGDYHNQNTGELHTDQIITIVDRSTVVRRDDIPSWMGSAPIRHVGWRYRQDNLWAMGPLDNLVGMQYRLDHLENLKADAMDLIVHPPLVIVGEVEEFVWAPEAEIHVDEGGSVGEASKSMQGVIGAANEMQALEDRMELYAGAPREAMGIRSPGEKTLGEVTQLASAAGRIFQEKVTNFEINLLEPNLNDMLETSVRNMNTSDVISTMDTALGVQSFQEITREDITANGKIRPVGARHFGKQAQDMQDLMNIMNSPIGQAIAPHTSGIELTKFVNDITGLNGYKIFRNNVAIIEQQQTQSLMNQGNEDLEVQASVDQGDL